MGDDDGTIPVGPDDVFWTRGDIPRLQRELAAQDQARRQLDGIARARMRQLGYGPPAGIQGDEHAVIVVPRVTWATRVIWTLVGAVLELVAISGGWAVHAWWLR